MYEYNHDEAVSRISPLRVPWQKIKAIWPSYMLPILLVFAGTYLTNVSASLKKNGSNSTIVFIFFWIVSQATLACCSMSRKFMGLYAMLPSSMP